MIVNPSTGGRPLSDRDHAVLLRMNEPTLNQLDHLAKETKSSRNTVQEACMRASQDPMFAAMIATLCAEIERENQLHPEPVEILEETKTLSLDEGYQHLDLHLRRTFTRDEALEGLSKVEPLTLETLQAEEDRIIEDLHQQELNEADKRATFFKGDALSGFIKVSRNEGRYSEEVKRISRKRDAQDRERQHHREKRATLLATAAMLLSKQLRESGNPQHHRQYEEPSCFATEGGATRKDRNALARALRGASKAPKAPS